MNKETGNNAAVNFLGRVIREQPEIVGDLSPRDQHIVLAHSDGKNQWTFKELGDTFGITLQSVRATYQRKMKKILESSPPDLQEAYPLTTVFESIDIHSPQYRANLRKRWQDPEFRARMDKAMRERWEDPEQKARASERRRGQKASFKTRVKMSEASQRTWQNPEVRQRRVDGLRKPETRQRISEANKGGTLSPLKRELLSESLRMRWQDPEKRERMIEGLRGRKQSPETKEKIGRANKIRALSPQAKARRREQARRQWEDPEFRERMAQLGRARWQDPEFRAKMKKGRDPDFQLWNYALRHGIVDLISEQGSMTSEDLNILRNYFQDGTHSTQLERVLNQFSKLVTNLA